MSILNFRITVCLIVHTSKSADDISQMVGFFHSTQLKDGKQQYKRSNVLNENLWTLSKKYSGTTSGGRYVCDFFETYPNLADRISAIKHTENCALRLSVVSEAAQVGFALSPADLQILNKLGIPFEVSVFSYGFCEDDSISLSK